MTTQNVFVYSLADLGITPANYNFSTIASGSTFTASANAAPSFATIEDNDAQDTVFNDGLPGSAASAPQQFLTGTIDGTVFTNAPTNPENEFAVFDSSGNAVGFIYDLHNANSAAFSSLQGYVSTFELVPGETYTVSRTTFLPNTDYDALLTCFAQNTRIEGEHGPVAVETLEPGDRVWTRDRGLQTIRWVGHRTVRGHGKYAPIKIMKGALGNTRTLRVSPLHRMLICSETAQLLFGSTEVLACAKHLVNGDTIFAEPCDAITYFHILFDQHEVIFAENCPTESFFPGTFSTNAIETALREELFSLFPELENDVTSYGPTVRPCLRGSEAHVLRLRGGDVHAIPHRQDTT